MRWMTTKTVKKKMSECSCFEDIHCVRCGAWWCYECQESTCICEDDDDQWEYVD